MLHICDLCFCTVCEHAIIIKSLSVLMHHLKSNQVLYFIAVDQFQTVRVQLKHAHQQLKAKQKSQKSDKAVQTNIITETATMETSFSVDLSKNKRSRLSSSPLSSFDLQLTEKYAGSTFALASR